MPRPININPFLMKATDKEVELMIYKDIGSWGITAENFRQTLNGIEKGKKIKLRINSYGGEVFDGFAIYNAIKERKNDIEIVVDGVAASIAAYITLAGSKISIYRNAQVMYHNPWGCVCGDSNEMRKFADLLDSMRATLIEDMKLRMKDWTDAEILEFVDDTTWLKAKEAVSTGLADEELDAISEVEEPETVIEDKIPENMKPFVFVNYKPKNAGAIPANKGVKDMDKCPHCNGEITAGVKFCNHCGKATDKAEAQRIASQMEKNELLAAERIRAKDIMALGEKFKLSKEKVTEYIESGKEYSAVLKEVVDIIPATPVAVAAPGSVTKDEKDKFRNHAKLSMAVALRLDTDPKNVAEIRANPGAYDMHTLMRACLEKSGQHSASEILNMSPEQLYSATVRMSGAGIGSSDLPNILADTMNKTFEGRFQTTDVTWPKFVATDEVNDFRTKSYTKMSSIGNLKNLPEGAAFDQAKFSDKKEQGAVDTSGLAINVSRNVMINNDVGFLTEIPGALADSALQSVEEDVFALMSLSTFVGPTLLEDSTAVFDDTAHNNRKANSGVVSATSLSQAETALMAMKLPKGTPDQEQRYGSAALKMIVTGTTNNHAIRELLQSSYKASSSSVPGTIGVPNLFAGVVPIFSPLLQAKLTDASLGNGFFWLADPMRWPTITVAFLRGNRTPTLRSEASRVGEALGFGWDLFWDWGVFFRDWRGIGFSDGATGG